MIRKIDHIGIAVERLSERLPFWAERLGLSVKGIETVEAEQVKVAFLDAGSSRIELLEPTDENSPVARFLQRRGEGIHHLTLEVADLRGLLAQLASDGVPVLGEAPRAGAGGREVAFLHPRAAGGVLVELVAAGPARGERSETLAPGCPILAYLREPGEKLWGVLRRLDATGVLIEGIDLASFDDWVAQIENREPSVVGASVLFVPMGRVEKLLLDRPSGDLPSLADRFERRTGRTVQDVLDAGA
jgi:methylmalonyl-CoA epimerase